MIASGDNVDVMTVGRMAITGPPMRRDTIFRIASMSKPITAAALMMLIDDGKLRLDEPVDRSTTPFRPGAQSRSRTC